jgi:putative addiction module component (TIGR02574 family)
MTTKLDKLTDEALDLPEDERAELAHALIVRIEEPQEGDVESAWDAEIKQRVDEIRSGEVEGIPAEDLRQELREE